MNPPSLVADRLDMDFAHNILNILSKSETLGESGQEEKERYDSKN